MIIKKLSEVFWPWVVKNIWPLVQQYIIQLAAEALAWLALRIKDLFNDKSNERAEQAKANSETAEQKAAEAGNNSNEYHAYKAEAEVWRKVAEQYKKDIEDLTQKVTALENESIEEFKEDIHEFTPEVATSEQSATVKIGNTTHQLSKP